MFFQYYFYTLVKGICTLLKMYDMQALLWIGLNLCLSLFIHIYKSNLELQVFFLFVYKLYPVKEIGISIQYYYEKRF